MWLLLELRWTHTYIYTHLLIYKLHIYHINEHINWFYVDSNSDATAFHLCWKCTVLSLQKSWDLSFSFLLATNLEALKPVIQGYPRRIDGPGPRDTVAAMAAWSNPKDIRRLRTEDKHPWNFIYATYSNVFQSYAGHCRSFMQRKRPSMTVHGQTYGKYVAKRLLKLDITSFMGIQPTQRWHTQEW